MIKFKPGEAERLAIFLSRVVPKSPQEAKELETLVKRCQGGRE